MPLRSATSISERAATRCTTKKVSTTSMSSALISPENRATEPNLASGTCTGTLYRALVGVTRWLTFSVCTTRLSSRRGPGEPVTVRRSSGLVTSRWVESGAGASPPVPYRTQSVDVAFLLLSADSGGDSDKCLSQRR